MNNINIYFQGTDNSFWYNHGVELMAAIVTLIAFLFTFWNITNTNKKQNIEEQKRNEKTLKMIDLFTQSQREETEKFNCYYSKSLETKPNKDGRFYLNLQLLDFETNSRTAFIVNDCCKYIEEQNLYNILINYENNIKELLLKQHTNLNLNTLEKVTSKLEDIGFTLILIDKLKSHQFISSEIIRENEEFLIKELEKYKQLNKIIARLSLKLIDNV